MAAILLGQVGHFGGTLMIDTSNLRRSVNLAALGLASGLLLATPAVAADLEPMLPPMAPAYSWSGFYIGGHIGAGQADVGGVFQNEDTAEQVLIGDINLVGPLGGIHGGFNWDIGTFVLGIEADASFMDWSDVAKSIESSDEVTAEMDMLASIRGRLGMPLGADRRAMVYATGGIAFADASATVFEDGRVDPDPLERRKYDFDEIGGVVGAGAEWAATDQFRVRIESLYYFFDDKHNILEDDQEVFSANEGDFVELENAWTVRVGASWHFATPGF